MITMNSNFLEEASITSEEPECNYQGQDSYSLFMTQINDQHCEEPWLNLLITYLLLNSAIGQALSKFRTRCQLTSRITDSSL